MTGKKTKEKKANDRMFFTEETQNAIIEFNSSDDVIERERLYNKHIRPAFEKLIDILIHHHGFYYANNNNPKELRMEAQEHLYERLNLYTVDKGKAYSYYTKILYNFLIVKNREAYKHLVEKTSSDVLDYENENTSPYEIADEEQTEVRLEMFDDMVNYLEAHIDKIFKTRTDHAIALAIMTLLKRRDRMLEQHFHKKALYVLIREMTRAKSQQITRVMKMFKKIYKILYTQYLLNEGDLSNVVLPTEKELNNKTKCQI